MADAQPKQESPAEGAVRTTLAKRPAETELTDLEQQFWLGVGKSAKELERARTQHDEAEFAFTSLLKAHDLEMGWISLRE